jgi:DNA (cytosine-5)-methyltransferase 1
MLSFSLIGESRFLYDKKDASFMDPPPPVDPHAASEPPNNCTICARREEEELQARGRFVRKDGVTNGVAVHGVTYHAGDFAFIRAEQGPARVGQIVGLYSGDPIWIKVQLLGRVSDLVNLLPDDELKDEVCLISGLLIAQPHTFYWLASLILHG